MKFIKQNTGLLRSVRNWGVLGLFLALVTVVSIYQQTQAGPPPNTVKLWESGGTFLSSPSGCILVALVASDNGSSIYPVQGYLVELHKGTQNGPTVGSQISGVNGTANFYVARPTTGVTFFVATTISKQSGLLVSNTIGCGARNSQE